MTTYRTRMRRAVLCEGAVISLLVIIGPLCSRPATAAPQSARGAAAIERALEISLGTKLGQCRAAPVELRPQRGSAVLLVYSADATVDPYSEMFFFPADTLKLALMDLRGTLLWRRDLGKGVVPGIWFCPVFPFDLDGDGADEIYLVGNADSDHPLGHDNRKLERLDSLTGQTTGQWPWPVKNTDEKLSYAHRNFILGGHAKGQPVLVTAQGTYQNMHLQAWRQDMTLRWQLDIAESDPGARGSHMCPITDLDGDGAEEVMWGERCIEVTGS